MIMTLPANDVFTLGSQYDPASLSLRSSSKLPFVSTSKASSPSPAARKPPRQPMSQAAPVAPAKSNHVANGNGSVHPRIDKANQNAPIDWEIPRKILHSSIGFLTLRLYTCHGSPRMVILVLSMALAIIVPADILRLNHAGFARVYERYLGFLMRESEKKSTNGVIWYIVGVLFVLSQYPLDVAVVAILILSWADTAASTIGRLWGSLTPPLPRYTPILGLPLAPRKSLAGFLAACATGACIGVGFWGWIGPLGQHAASWSWEQGGWLSLSAVGAVSGLVSGVAEGLDLGSLDDNLTLPIISGGCIWGFLRLLQLLPAM